jgi:circadian clock protein KaiC
LLLGDAPDRSGDNELEVLVHGTLRLERRSPDYGSDRRRLQVAKLHGADYHDGWHDVRIRKGVGVEVFPRLKIEDRVQPGTREAVRSGVGGLDELLEGGLELGTACLLTGPDGAGKTSLATLYLHAAASSGRRGAAYLFDERPGTFFARGESLGMDLKSFAEDDMIDVRTIQTGEISPGEFAHRVREDVVERGAEIVCIDSLSGYVNAMPQERLLMIHMQELLSFLNRQEVLTLLIVSESGVVGSVQHKEVEIGYMADSVVLLRHFEAEGTIRQAISAVKRRHGQHERTIRELQITPEKGIAVGPPITAFSGVLSGTPAFEGETDVLLERRSGDGNGDPSPA